MILSLIYYPIDICEQEKLVGKHSTDRDAGNRGPLFQTGGGNIELEAKCRGVDLSSGWDRNLVSV